MNQSKSNGRGGRRLGAGRKPGSATQKTREIADKAAAEGITPLEVMLATMRAFYADAMKVPEAPDMEKMVMAASVGKDAAPYIHAKLSAVEMNASVTMKTLDQELSELNAALRDSGSHPPVA